MLHHRFDASRLDNVVFYTQDNTAEYGKMFIGSDGIVRFFTHHQIQQMEGLGRYNPATGHPVYDDGIEGPDEQGG